MCLNQVDHVFRPRLGEVGDLEYTLGHILTFGVGGAATLGNAVSNSSTDCVRSISALSDWPSLPSSHARHSSPQQVTCLFL